MHVPDILICSFELLKIKIYFLLVLLVAISGNHQVRKYHFLRIAIRIVRVKKTKAPEDIYLRGLGPSRFNNKQRGIQKVLRNDSSTNYFLEKIIV